MNEAPLRRETRTVMVGNLPIGGGNPIVIQSMLKTAPDDIDGGLACINELAAAGCGLIRIAVPDAASLKPMAEICRKSVLPVVADVHFTPALAMGALEAGVAKIRLNPGNTRDRDGVSKVVRECVRRNVPIRVGANSGSVKARTRADERSMVDALLEEVISFCEFVESCGSHDIIVSLKASDVLTNTLVYRRMSELADYPLHIGLTATGPIEEGTIRSAIALGSLLVDGIGDTLRVSLTGEPRAEVELAKSIMRSVGVMFDRPRVVSCPTCGRCGHDLRSMVDRVSKALATSERRITVAVMGCVVNGPGEARECDYGVACSNDKAVLFARGEVVAAVAPDEAVEALLRLIDEDDATA